MRVEFLERCSRDLDKVTQRSIRESVEKIILKVESAKSLSEIPHIKKLSGHKSAFRIRLGNYRIGIFVEGNIVQFARIVHRKDIYKIL